MKKRVNKLTKKNRLKRHFNRRQKVLRPCLDLRFDEFVDWREAGPFAAADFLLNSKTLHFIVQQMLPLFRNAR